MRNLIVLKIVLKIGTLGILGFHIWGCNQYSLKNFDQWSELNQIYKLVGLPENSNLKEEQKKVFSKFISSLKRQMVREIIFDSPLDESVYPADFVSPTFLWSDKDTLSNIWFIHLEFPKNQSMYTFALSPSLGPLNLDSNAFSPLTKIPQASSLNNWKANKEWWEVIKKHSKEKPIHMHVYGYDKKNPEQSTSYGSITFSTSQDSVKVPIFYRDVPIKPSRNKKGKIKPLSKKAQNLIKWRLKHVSRDDNKLIMEKIHSCANCHSFSSDGQNIGLDVDGPQSDKGAYALKKIDRVMTIEHEDVISWNHDYKEKPKGAKTLGFLSRVSPTGNYVVTTVNEKLFVANFMREDFIQVFYPTRGVLAFYNKQAKKIKLLPGADDTAYVHCNPVWTPDEKHIIFARAKAKDPYVKDQPMPKKANDPEETQIQYDLFKIPFNEGRGGKPVPILGAGNNGMSNSFPKVTPNGKFIVFVKSKNGQLMRPDGKLWILPVEGGEPRLMNCNTSLMNSWHSFSPNGKWMVFSSKSRSYYTQMFLTHIDEEGTDTPPVLITNATAANRAINLPEFVNRDYASFDQITVPAVNHFKYLMTSRDFLLKKDLVNAKSELYKAMEAAKKDDHKFQAEVLVMLGWLEENKNVGLKLMDQAVKKDPQYFGAHFDMAVINLNMGREKKAIYHLNQVLDLSPKYPLAFGKLAEVYGLSTNKKIRDIKKALELAEKACELTYYKEKELLKTLGWILSEAGKKKESVDYLTKVVDMYRKDEQIQQAQEVQKEINFINKGLKFTEIYPNRNKN